MTVYPARVAEIQGRLERATITRTDAEVESAMMAVVGDYQDRGMIGGDLDHVAERHPNIWWEMTDGSGGIFDLLEVDAEDDLYDCLWREPGQPINYIFTPVDEVIAA